MPWAQVAFFIYSGPIALLALSYYFFNHLGHLLGQAEKNKETFGQFAWMPLSLEWGWRYEVWATCVALPVGALCLMASKLIELHSVTLTSGTVLLIGTVGSGLLGCCAFRRMQKLRGIVGKDVEKQCSQSYKQLTDGVRYRVRRKSGS